LKQSLKINILIAVITVLLSVAVLLMNAIAVMLSERFHLQVDLTYGRVYEIGDDTKNLLSMLDTPVEIFVLSDITGFSGSPYLVQAQQIMDQYPRYSDMITLEYVDYATNPLFAVHFPELSLTHGDLIFRSGDNVHQVFAANLFHFSQQPDGNISIMASRAEEAISSAILHVISDDAIEVALLTGNGASDGGVFPLLLTNNNYSVSSVSLSNPVFDDFDVLMLFAPTIDLSEEVVRGLEAFLYNDGRYGKILFYTADVSQGAMPNLDMFLAEWGIQFTDGAVFETNPERTYNFQPFYPTAEYVEERYVNMLRDPSMPMLMPLARPMEFLFTARDGYHVETLVTFSETSGVRPADAGEDFTAHDNARPGPIPALVRTSFNTLTADDEHLRSYIIVSASTGMFEQLALQNTSVSNVEYLLNLIGDMTERTDHISIVPVSLAGRTLGVTSAQATRLAVVMAIIIPLVILLGGIGSWLYRRYR